MKTLAKSPSRVSGNATPFISRWSAHGICPYKITG